MSQEPQREFGEGKNLTLHGTESKSIHDFPALV